ncbi:sensor domain-containing protein [Mycobacterium sp. NPDC050441]|uniref:sensor domain-containing protein n=1 Tax=Mycobacterium sp. NPDC050441 TaxID=3155403 RepID=UPI0033D165AC
MNVLSVDEVRSISGVAGFHEVPELDATTPSTVPDTPAACRAVFDPPTVYGTDWTQFRTVGYSADLDTPVLPIMADVRQAVAAYPDSAAAQAAFDRLTAAVPGCTSTGTAYYRRSAEAPDPNTLLLNSEDAAGAHNGYRLTGTKLINSSALGLPDSERVGLEVLDALEDAQR